MKVLWWPHRGGQGLKSPPGMGRHPGPGNGRKLGPPSGLKDKLREVTLKSLFRGWGPQKRPPTSTAEITAKQRVGGF